ncbi:unnamed protein product [Notodromas monacha]|uniref:TBC domain-containing protein kinase-like protein n=1 Tax=Notodromas monacha TaxID=399045 RepID=A0A7R9BIW3_9CRUS|nr:unnamed protein product [Notodromas monacha]CAG0915447.1 unnamed protein product [Notodromas monacha]
MVSFVRRSTSLDDAALGASTFTASLHSIESCGSDGLPLTPNAIKILGRFEVLRNLSHPNLCRYVHMERGKHERLMCVTETFSATLQECFDAEIFEATPMKVKLKILYDIVDAVAYLRSQGILHRNLRLSNIMLDARGNVKLFDFGLFHLTDSGCLVSFPIGNIEYFAPEVLSMSHKPCDPSYAYLANTACDAWIIGMLSLEILTGRRLWPELSADAFCINLFKVVEIAWLNSSSRMKSQTDVLDELVRAAGLDRYIEEWSDEIKSFLRQCLVIHPNFRAEVQELANHAIFTDFRRLTVRSSAKTMRSQGRHFLPIHLEAVGNADTSTLSFWNCFGEVGEEIAAIWRSILQKNASDVENLDSNSSKHLLQQSPKEVFFLWQLAGGDLDTEFRKVGLIRTKPPILCLPRLGLLEGEMFGMERDKNRAYNKALVELSLDQLRSRLQNLSPRSYYPLLDEIEKSDGPFSESSKEAVKLPLVIREKDVEYQLHRMLVFKRLLEGYPFTRSIILKEARNDISPFYRAEVWASLLDVISDVEADYEAVDKETPTATDRQIEVDIPRCHQYDELLASPTGHQKFKRILKAWVASHPQYVYWQGLDSLCAPFLRLNFCDEALAFACLSKFIDKYLAGFFLKDNSPVIQEYLATFSHLIAFHDPQLFNHLDEIGFIPELYAIPWFLTMYTHVFPLPKILHLWDKLLLGPPSFPLCVGVGLLHQLRDSLLSFSFNDCILLFSDMPQIDIERCVQDSIRFFRSTPPSVLHRSHEAKISFKVIGEHLVDDLPDMVHSASASDKLNLSRELEIHALPLASLKSEKCPRISAKDLLDLLNWHMGSPETPTSPGESPKTKVLPVDVRPKEEFQKGCVPGSVNIPLQVVLDFEQNVTTSTEFDVLFAARGKIIVVVGNRGNSGAVRGIVCIMNFTTSQLSNNDHLARLMKFPIRRFANWRPSTESCSNYLLEIKSTVLKETCISYLIRLKYTVTFGEN